MSTIAKAIAALLVPFAVAGLNKLADMAGVPHFDTAAVSLVVVPLVTAVAVWAVRNQPQPDA